MKRLKSKKILRAEENETIDRLGIRNRKIFQKLYEFNPDLNKAEIASLLGVSRKTIYEFIKKIKEV